MPLACIACTCGFSDKLIRTRLEAAHAPNFLTTPITKGKEKSKSLLNTLPQYPQIDMLRNHLDNCSKYAVVIGYDNEQCRWVDLATGKAVQNNIDLEFIVRDFV